MSLHHKQTRIAEFEYNKGTHELLFKREGNNDTEDVKVADIQNPNELLGEAKRYCLESGIAKGIRLRIYDTLGEILEMDWTPGEENDGGQSL